MNAAPAAPVADAIHLHWLEHAPGAGRAPLRAVLGACLGIAADTVPIVQVEAHHKPRLAPPHDWLDFNWSHSGDLAVVAVARGLPIGIDVERIDRAGDPLAIARRFFADDETRALARLDGVARRQLFARLWTIKEAVLKAAGSGLAHGLARVVVDVNHAPPRLSQAIDGEPGEWQLHTVMPPRPGFAAMLAWRGSERHLVVHGTELSSHQSGQSPP